MRFYQNRTQKMSSAIQTEIKSIDWFVSGFIKQISTLKIANYKMLL